VAREVIGIEELRPSDRARVLLRNLRAAVAFPGQRLRDYFALLRRDRTTPLQRLEILNPWPQT
jgi:hypothetical protein